MKYLKKYENPDWVRGRKDGGVDTNDELSTITASSGNAFAFAYNGGRIRTSEFYKTHSSIGGRIDTEFPGRAWVDEKIISFWVYPPKDRLMKMLKDVEKDFNSNHPFSKINITEDWYIDLPSDNDNEVTNLNACDWDEDDFSLKFNPILIRIKDYLKSNIEGEWSEEEKNISHFKIGSGSKDSEYGSRLKSKRNPIEWEQAKRTSENMIEKFNEYLNESRIVDNLVVYVFGTYINGNKQHAKDTCEEIKKKYEVEEIQDGLYLASQKFSFWEFIKIAKFVGFSNMQIKNAFFDNGDMENFSKL